MSRPISLLILSECGATKILGGFYSKAEAEKAKADLLHTRMVYESSGYLYIIETALFENYNVEDYWKWFRDNRRK